MARHNDVGKWGEDVAADYLQQQGFSIIERNWKVGRLEVDIIAIGPNLVLFVEVKTRRNDNFGSPYESVDWRKQKNLLAAMRQYMAIKFIQSPMRYDIISIVGCAESYELEHIENAVSNFIY